MQVIFGIIFHFIGGSAAGSFYVPYKKIKGWHWESYWIVGGLFSWLIIDSFYVQEHFYQSLGANHTTYNPAAMFSDTQLVPTELDNYYRYQTIQGYVHDMGAAMQNGVGGHAGIFSTTNDVAKIMQMYLQKGYYGGKRYLKTETLEKFNFCYYCGNGVRRGVGFDKPQSAKKGQVSLSSFGHSGFTGTYAWADPEEEIVYVFLSNRTYPNEGKNILQREGIRAEIQRLIYEAIIK